MTASGLPEKYEQWVASMEGRWRHLVDLVSHDPNYVPQGHSVLAGYREFRQLRDRWIDLNMKGSGTP